MEPIKKLWILLVLVFTACHTSEIPECVMPDTPDYTKEQMWYVSDKDAEADVFYILPTCVWDWQDTSGNIIHYADVYNPEHIEALLPSNQLAAEIFGMEANFYSPYYRQITLDSWMEGERVIEERFPYAMDDVNKAFTYYMEHENNGRPFVLAGFSQGAKCVVELLKSLKPEIASRLIAAYVIGYRVTEEEIETYSSIQPAQKSDDTGVTICYNSVESPASICPVLSPSAICINPLNWRCDTVTATTSDNVTVQVDPVNKVLLVKGLDCDKYYLPSLGSLFPKGNYHLQELTLYKESLQNNVKIRKERYLELQTEQ